MPKAFSDSEKQWIQQRLLEKGRELFEAQGLRKTSVADLAEAAGISKGAFYLFYASKEALFMDVAERAENQFRNEVLRTVDLPGPSPRARLAAVLRRAFALWKTLPVLQIITRSDYEVLARRMPAASLQEHLKSDRAFVERLVARCRNSGIPIQAGVKEIDGLLHALFFVSLHENDLGLGALSQANDTLLDLVAAYCLGETPLQTRRRARQVERLKETQ